MKIDRWIVPRRFGQKLSLEVVSIWHSSLAVGVGVAAVAKTNTRKTEIDLETETERNNFRLR